MIASALNHFFLSFGVYLVVVVLSKHPFAVFGRYYSYEV